MNVLKLVTFDVTGTLLKFDPLPAVIYSQTAKEYGINVSADAITSHFKTEWQKLSAEHPNYGCHTGLGWHKWWKAIVKNSIVRADPTLSPGDTRLDELSEFLIKEYRTAKWWALTDGAKDILDHLKTAKIPIGVISNYDPRLENVLEDAGIKQYFKFVLTSYTAGVMKPDIKIFKAAESHIPSAQPSCCLHVGDNVELDYRGAINAGWSAAIIGQNVNKKGMEVSKDHVFASLRDLQNKLEQTQYKTF